MLLKFYEEQLSNYALVYKRLLINIIIVVFSLFLFTFIAVFLILYKNYGLLSIVTVVIFGILVSIGLFLQYKFVTIPSRNLACESYEIKLNSTQWEFFRLYLLREYLVENKLIDKKNENAKENKEKIAMIIAIFQQKLENRQKNKPFSILGSYFNTSIVFLIPIWAAFINQIYFKNVTLYEGLQNIGVIFGCLLALIALFYVIRLYKIVFNFLSFDYKLHEILYMLTQLQVIHNNDNFAQKHKIEDKKKKIESMVHNYIYDKPLINKKNSFFKKYSYFNLKKEKQK